MQSKKTKMTPNWETECWPECLVWSLRAFLALPLVSPKARGGVCAWDWAMPGCLSRACNDFEGRFVQVCVWCCCFSLLPLRKNGTSQLSCGHMLACSDCPGTTYLEKVRFAKATFFQMSQLGHCEAANYTALCECHLGSCFCLYFKQWHYATLWDRVRSCLFQMGEDAEWNE